MGQDISEKVYRGLRHLEKYDFASFRAMCTDKATVWQNDGNGEQAIDQRMEQFTSFVDTVDSLRYDVIRQFQNSNEVLQQHVIQLVMADGSSSEVHSTVYFRFDGGLIDRIEEYAYTVSAD